jgi:hypothetical protein
MFGNPVFTPYNVPLAMHGTTASGDSPYEAPQNEDRPVIYYSPFQAGPVTIQLTVGVEYGYDATISTSAKTTPGCQTNPNFGFAADVKPSVNFGVWASANASVAGFGIGFEIDLTLLQVGIPLNARVGMMDNQPDTVSVGEPNLEVMDTSIDLALQMSTLDGSFDIYGLVFGFHVWDTQLASWQGPTWTVPLFHTPEVKIPIKYLTTITTNPSTPPM